MIPPIAYLALALLLSVGANAYQWRECAVNSAKAAEKVQTAQAAALAVAERAARDAEAASTEKSYAVGEAYEKGKLDAQVATDRFVADLRADNGQLRDRWKSCAASRVPETGTAAIQPDAATAEQRESLDRIASHMGRARGATDTTDAQVIGLQNYIRTVCLAPAVQS